MKRTSNPLTTLLLVVFLVTGYRMASAQNNSRFTDPRDGHTYRTVTIGNQTWMAENLAWLPAVDRVGTGLFETRCYYVYGYDGTDTTVARKNPNFKAYGVLYNWLAAGSACPEGWHLPTDFEWRQLEQNLGMSAEETLLRDWRNSGSTGDKLKTGDGWKTRKGTNESGFSALPGGCRGYGGFESLGWCAYFWTASTIDGDNGWRRGICSDLAGISRQEDRRYFGCSVRCVKND
jgi:uncharacterized protein (TIGR02145 family)